MAARVGRRNGEEVAVDAVVLVAEDGNAYAMRRPGQGDERFPRWLAEWKAALSVSACS